MNLTPERIDEVLRGTKYDPAMVFHDSEGKPYNGADNLRDMDYVREDLARGILLEGLVDTLMRALEFYKAPHGVHPDWYTLQEKEIAAALQQAKQIMGE